MSQEERDRLRRSTIACFAKLARTIKIQEKPSPPPAPSQLNPSTTANRTPRQMITNPSPNPGQHTNPGPPQEILNSLEQLLLNNAGLFDVFARDIACGTNPEVDQVNLDFWRNAILCLPGRLAANPTAQTSAGQQAPTNSVLPSPAASASSQVLPTSIGPHASNIPVQTPVASGSQPIAGSSYLQVPIVHTGPQASPSPSGATTASTSQVLSSSGTTSTNTQASTSSGSPAPVPTPQIPPMTRNEARVWLRGFANSRTGAGGVLGTMAKDLITKLNQNP